MKIYFIGVNGIGVSGLAKISKFLGHDVYGSDQLRTPMSETLEAQGITFYDSHCADRIKEMDVIVYSTAVKMTNPELIEAIKLKKLIFKRGEYLAKLMHFQEGIAVAGAHGKTTTTSMCAMLFLPSDATFYIGGVLPEVKDTVHPGTSSIFISEADESDNSFLFMHPKYSIITNIEPDHIDFHGSFDHIKESFEKFMEQTSKEIVACGECDTLLNMVKKHPKKARLYGFDTKFDIVASHVRVEGTRTLFNISIDGVLVYENIEIIVPGRHNVLNATASIYVAHQCGIAENVIREQIKKFTGAKRRFDIIYNDGFTIIDDYAHHPTEISATIEAAKTLNAKRLVVVYQPHRYSRTNFLFDAYYNVFKDITKGFILPIYSAGEENVYKITELDLCRQISENNNVEVIDESAVMSMIPEQGDLLIFMGAGNITYLAQKFAQKFIKIN